MLLVHYEKEELRSKVLLLRWVLQGTINPVRIKVPEPKAYNGVRSANELENFLWYVENYFKATRISMVKRYQSQQCI